MATVDINGKYGKLMNQGNCTVSDFKVEGNTISYNYLANSIPMSKNVDFVAEGEKIMDYIDSISYETFKVADLPAGEYKLLIDGGEIATFTAEELAQGVNLAQYNTPMIKQSESAAKLVTTLTEYQRTLRTMIVCEFRAEIYGGAKTQEAREAWMRGRINAGGDSYASRYNQYLSQIKQQSIDKRYEFVEMMWKNAYNAAKPTSHKIELINLSGDYVIEQMPIEPPVDDTPDTPDTPDAPKGNIAPVIIAVAAVAVVAAAVIVVVIKKKKEA